MNFEDLKNDYSNKTKIAIVCVGYNRIGGLQRLLNSLQRGEYPEGESIPLVISIDCSGNEELYEYARSYEWNHGAKYVNIQNKRLGLRDHIYQCGDLTKYFKAVVLLEDDLFVSKHFYSYVVQTLNRYGDDSRIAQISLYKNEINGYVGLPFSERKTDSDVFLMQDVSTWGECWNERMWNKFVEWRETSSEDKIRTIDMSSIIKNWTRAWSKYYNAYVVDTGKFVIYPSVSHSTNFNDAGGEHGSDGSFVQVSLMNTAKTYNLPDFDKLEKYDIYFNNIHLYKWLGISPDDLCLDLYGYNRNEKQKKYLLSTKILPYKVIRSFSLSMRPIEVNVEENLSGDGIFLYDTNSQVTPDKGIYSKDFVRYHLQGFDYRLLLKEVSTHFRERLCVKLRLKK